MIALRRVLISTSTIAAMFVALPVAASADGSAKVACWQRSGKAVVGYKERPRSCYVVPQGAGHPHYLFGFTWQSFGGLTARGHSSDYREWADVAVRLDRPTRRCGHLAYSRALLRYVGYGGGDKVFTISLKTC
jgi:hypothetical protein